MKKNIIKIVSFLVVFSIIFAVMDKAMRFKYSDGIKQSDIFYEQDKNSVDVLILGSSHAFMNIYPSVLWDKYGMSSFIFSASVQPIWNSYYFMEEALKTQTPKLIVYEGYRLVDGDEYESPSTEIKSVYGLKWSSTKIKSIVASFPKDKIPDYAFEFSNYHSRYNEINSSDFLPYYNFPYYEYYKGEIAASNSSADKKEQKDISGYSESIPITEKSEKYYKMMMELAKSKNIPFITVVAPYDIPNIEYSKLLYAKSVSENENCTFINFNDYYDELNIDFNSDFTKDNHLVYSGAMKFTEYLGKYISDNYTIPDHRNDEKYASWAMDSELFKRYYRKNELTSIKSLSEYAATCKKKGNYSLILTVNGSDMIPNNILSEIKKTLGTIGVESSVKNGVWYYNGESLVYSNTDSDAFSQTYRLNRHSDLRIGNTDFKITNSLTDAPLFFAEINDEDSLYTKECGATLTIYDNLLQAPVETVFTSSDGDTLLRENDKEYTIRNN